MVPFFTTSYALHFNPKNLSHFGDESSQPHLSNSQYQDRFISIRYSAYAGRYDQIWNLVSRARVNNITASASSMLLKRKLRLASLQQANLPYATFTDVNSNGFSGNETWYIRLYPVDNGCGTKTLCPETTVN